MSIMTLRMIAVLLSHGQKIASHEMVEASGVFGELKNVVWC